MRKSVLFIFILLVCSLASCRKEQIVDVTGVVVSPTGVFLRPGETAALHATVLPENASDRAVSWFSSDTTIATVDRNGLVTAVSQGNATVTVRTDDRGYCAPCTVSVSNDIVHVTSVTLDRERLTLYESESDTLHASVLPPDATDKHISWSSSNTDAVTVDANGVLTAIRSGEATITVTTRDGGLTKTCAVSVKCHVESVSLDAERLDLNVGTSATLHATVLPENASDRAVVWSIDDPSVASLTDGTVTALKAGTTTARVTTRDGGKSASCAICVNEIRPQTIPVQSVSLDCRQLSLEVGASEKLTASVLPDNATQKTLTWTSSEPDKASVSPDGLVTAISSGNTTITATATDGSGKYASCTVTVSVPVTPVIHVSSVSVEPSTASLSVGATAKLSAIVLPEDAADRTVTWSSENAAIASVSQDGLVTAVSKGETVITARSADGGKTSSCTVNVVSTTVTQPDGVYFGQTSLTMTVNDIVEVGAYPYVLNKGTKVVIEDELTFNVTIGGSVLITRTGNNTVIVRAQKPETPKLTAKTSNGHTATCSITVLPIALQSLSFVPDAVSLKVGEKMTLEPRIQPWNATSSSTRWSSSNSKVVSVSSNGTVTALAQGEATITFTFNRANPDNPIKSLTDIAKCTVRVKPADVSPGGVESILFEELN